jgi:hypothetical protein
VRYIPSECPKCGSDLASSPKGGRPSRFWCEGCKLSAEAEMRRLNVVLRRLEDDRANEPLRGWGCADAAKVQAAVAKFDEAIAPLQKRFDHLAGVPKRASRPPTNSTSTRGAPPARSSSA